MGEVMTTSVFHSNVRTQDDLGQWFAIRVKFRSEKWVAKRLASKDIEAYVPVLKRTKRYARKIKHLEIPLISNYVFVHIRNKGQRLQVLQTPYVFSFVSQNGVPVSIPLEQIDLMKKVVDSNYELNVTDQRFDQGDKVEIIGGSLTGIKAQYVKALNKNLLVVQLSSIGQNIVLEIEKKYLRKTR